MLIVVEILLLASGIDIAIVTLLVHPIEAAFRLHDVGFAAISAVPVAIGVAVAYYPAGLLADTFPRRNVIAAGAVTWAIAALVASHASSQPMFFLARLLAGIGTGASHPAIISMISDAFPRTRRAVAVSIYAAGAAVGGGIGLTTCGALVAATQRNGMIHLSGILLSPWQQCFIACAAMGLVVLALVLTISEPSRKERSTVANANLTATLRTFGEYIWRHRLLWGLLLIGYAIGMTSIDSSGYWGPVFGMRHFGIRGIAPIALLGTFTAAGALLGSFGGGLLAQRGINHRDPRIVPRMLVAIAVLSCVSVVSFPSMPSWFLAVVGIGGIRVAFYASGVLLIIGIQETAPNEIRAQLVGALGIVALIPSLTGSMLVAFVASTLFAKAGALGPALATVGGITSLLAMFLYVFAGGPYERARQEMRALDASTQTLGNVPNEASA
jgi:MFS family permease